VVPICLTSQVERFSKSDSNASLNEAGSEIGKFRNAEEARPVLRLYSFQHPLWDEMEKNQTAEMLLTIELHGISIVPLTATREYKGFSGLEVV
jgi:hypothetical protein